MIEYFLFFFLILPNSKEKFTTSHRKLEEHGSYAKQNTPVQHNCISFDVLLSVNDVLVIPNNNKTEYCEEINNPAGWCKEKNLLLNVSKKKNKTKVMIVDLRKKEAKTLSTSVELTWST